MPVDAGVSLSGYAECRNIWLTSNRQQQVKPIGRLSRKTRSPKQMLAYVIVSYRLFVCNTTNRIEGVLRSGQMVG